MLQVFFDSATHDPFSGTLTVKTIAPSRAFWSKEEYRDVPADLAAGLAAAAPHGAELLRERVAPFHESRRIDEGTWRTPEPVDPDSLEAANANGAVRA